MRILISGAAGYLGSYLLHHLKDHSITGIDNFLTQRYSSLFDIPQNVNFIESSFQSLSTNFLRQFDVVIHLAAIVDAANSFNNKESIEQINEKQTIEFIQKCNKAQIDHFIFPSSTSVYGKSTTSLYIKENDENVINPQSPYAESKFKVEIYIKDNIQNMNYSILRLGTICGWSPGIRWQTSVNKFCFHAALRKPIPIWKNALDFYRPYLTLEDALYAIENLISKPSRQQIFNILTENHTIREILNKISKHKFFTIDYTDSPLINQYNYKISNQKFCDKYSVQVPNQSINYSINQIFRKLEHINP